MFAIEIEDGREAPSKARKKGAKRLEILVHINFFNFYICQLIIWPLRYTKWVKKAFFLFLNKCKAPISCCIQFNYLKNKKFFLMSTISFFSLNHQKSSPSPPHVG